MARVLVTGGCGFIGRHVAAELLAHGHEAVLYDALIDQVHGAAQAAVPEGAEVVRGDVRDADRLRPALKGCDAVIHLAAEVGVGQSMYEISRYVGANDLGTAVLLEAILNHPVRRLVVASSMSVYGEGFYATASGERVEAARRDPAAVRAVVSLGSNVGNRAALLARARAALAKLPETRLLDASAVRETEPVDVPPEFAAQKFLNQAAVFETTLAPQTFARAMHAIEDRLGRVRTVRNGPRTIDLDLILFGDVRLETPELTLPHPRAHLRAFVREPLAELGIDLRALGPHAHNRKAEGRT